MPKTFPKKGTTAKMKFLQKMFDGLLVRTPLALKTAIRIFT